MRCGKLVVALVFGVLATAASPALASEEDKSYVSLLTPGFQALANLELFPSEDDSNLQSGRRLLYDEGGKIDKLVTRKRNIIRRNLKAQAVGKDFDLGSSEYVESLGIMMTPGVLFAFLSLVGGIVFCVGRYKFDAFGGRKVPKGGYTRQQRMVIFGINAAIMTVFIITLIVGLANSSKLTKGTNNFTSDLSEGVAKIVADTRLAVDTLEDPAVVPNQNLPKDNNVQRLLTDADSAFDTINKASKTIREIDQIRVTVLAFSLCVAVMAGLFLLLSGMLRKGILSTIGFFLIVTTLVLTWLSVGVNIPLGVAIADYCYAQDQFSDASVPPPLPGSKEGVAFFLSCFEPEAAGGVVNTTVISIANDVFVINRDGVNLPPIIFNSTADPFVQIGDLKTSIAEVEDNFDSQPFRVQSALGRFKQLVTVLETSEGIVSCNSVRSLYIGTERSICFDVLSAIDIILIISALQGCIAFLGVYSGISGHKKFHKLKEEEKLNFGVGDDKARGAFQDADEEEAIELQARSNAQLSADKWSRI